MIWELLISPLIWIFGMLCAAAELRRVIADLEGEKVRQAAVIAQLVAQNAHLATALTDARDEADRLDDVLDAIAELPERSRARELAREELGLPWSDWPQAVAA